MTRFEFDRLAGTNVIVCHLRLFLKPVSFSRMSSVAVSTCMHRDAINESPYLTLKLEPKTFMNVCQVRHVARCKCFPDANWGCPTEGMWEAMMSIDRVRKRVCPKLGSRAQ